MAQADPVAEAKRWLATDPEQSARLARQILARVPGSVGAQFVLAAARRRLGDHRGALELLDRLSIPPALAWGMQFERGMALAAVGDVERAIESLERTVAGNPKATLAWHALGDQLMIAGRGPDAGAARRRSGITDRALVSTVHAFLDGDEAASWALITSFGLDQRDAASVCLIADIGAQSGRFEPVVWLLTEILRVAPRHYPAQFHLAMALHNGKRDVGALATIEPLLAERPGVTMALALRAAIAMRLGREAQAAADFRAALDLEPDSLQLWLGYGDVLRALGQHADAVAAYRRAIAIRPTFGEAYWALANLKTGTLTTADRQRMAGMLSGAVLDDTTRTHLHFALGRAEEEAGHHETAFTHIAQANALRHESRPHDAAAHSTFIDRTIANFTPRFLAERCGMGQSGTGPIFVLGMPRSGSTLVEQILASHSAVEGASEIPEIMQIAEAVLDRRRQPENRYPEAIGALAPAGFAKAGAAYFERTRARRPLGRPYFVDKHPANFQHIGLIHLILPDALIIDVRRDPLDCCVSLFTQDFAEGQGYSNDLGDLGRFYADYVRLMRHFDTVLPGRILRVRYEALVGDFEAQVRRLLDHCGLPFEPGVLRFFDNDRAVATPSSEQVRQPIYTHGVGRWRRFAPWLGPLQDALGSVVDQETLSA